VYDEFTKEIISKSFEVKIESDIDTQTLPGIISRKKQIIPMLKL
jgi:inorganic pyrophosphatase/exopolyphosphatase